MPKFNGQNKRRIDPRYFLNEQVEGEELDPPWKDPSEKEREKDPMYMHGRAKDLATSAMDSQMSGGDGVTDVHLDLLGPEEVAALENIKNHLDTVVGGGNRGEMFTAIMKKLGIELGGSHRPRGQMNIPGLEPEESDQEKHFS